MRGGKRLGRRILTWAVVLLGMTWLGLWGLQEWLGDWFIPSSLVGFLDDRAFQEIRQEFYYNVGLWLLLGLLTSILGLLLLHLSEIRQWCVKTSRVLARFRRMRYYPMLSRIVTMVLVAGLFSVWWWHGFQNRELPEELAGELLVNGDGFLGGLVALEIREPHKPLNGLLRKALRAPIPVSLTGHEAPVSSISFHSDGTRVVTASEDATARIWDVGLAETDIKVTILDGHAGEVYNASFSPDGTRVVTASADRTARIWDADTGRTRALLEGHQGRVLDASFSPDGTRRDGVGGQDGADLVHRS